MRETVTQDNPRVREIMFQLAACESLVVYHRDSLWVVFESETFWMIKFDFAMKQRVWLDTHNDKFIVTDLDVPLIKRYLKTLPTIDADECHRLYNEYHNRAEEV